MARGHLQRLHRQLKNENDGASLVTVLVVVSLVMIMITVLLGIVVVNFYMKKQNEAAQENFYNAEAAMEEIRQGLLDEVSAASAVAYTKTLVNYEDGTEAEKYERFQEYYLDELRSLIQQGDDTTLYSASLLRSFFKETKWDDDSETGAQLIVASEGANALNDLHLNATSHCLELKNVTVSYTDEDANYTEIQTDIYLDYPEISFRDANSLSDILSYGIIAGDNFTADSTGDISIVGNAYLGRTRTRLTSGTRITMTSSGRSRGYVVAGNLQMSDSASLTIDSLENWFGNISLNNASLTVNDGWTYLANDLLLVDSGTTATFSRGDFIAYGNDTAAVDSAYVADIADENNVSSVDTYVNNNAALYNSSIILQGKTATGTEDETKLDLSEVETLLLAGTTYINGDVSISSSRTAANGTAIQTGQSITTTGDQRAYLVPADLIGMSSETGGANPMTASMYEQLYSDLSASSDEDLVDFSSVSRSLGTSLNAAGVTGIQKLAMQTTGAGTLYYFFMEFSDDTALNTFVQTYYSRAVNYSRLQENIDYYAEGGIELPSSSADPLTFYLQGNALATNSSRLLVSDTLRAVVSDTATYQNLLSRETSYFDQFGGLLFKLTKDYDSLTSQEISTGFDEGIFNNIVDTDSIKTTTYFVSETGYGAVVTATDDATVSDLQDALESYAARQGISGATLNLIISTGDIEVDADFEGTIIAKETIKVKGTHTITANVTKAAIAILATNDDGKNAASYLIDGVSSFVGGSASSDDESTDAIDLSDYIIYHNWEKH